MVTKRSSHLDRILGRLDDLDSVNLTILVQRLARERELLETVFNVIQEGILVISRTGIIEYSNAAASQLIGLRESEVGQAVLWKLMPDLARTLSLDIDAKRSASPSISREVEVTYPEHRFLRLYMVPLNESETNSDKSQFAILLSDITEDKVSTEELIANEKLSSIFDLAASVAHELGNPLNSVNIHLQLMKRQLAKLGAGTEAEKLKESLRVCSNEVERLDGIIAHFLNAMRPQPLDMQDLQVLEVITEVIEFQENELKDLGINVEVAIREDLPHLMGDRNQLKQVFFNLIKNAMEAMDRGGELRISTRSDDQFVYVHLADTGQGISQEDLAKVFNPYFTSKAEGHGLGMMIVQRIMRDHGGQIGIDSQYGTGTVVTLQFPQKHRRMRMLEQRSE